MADKPPIPDNSDDRKKDLLKEVQQDRAAADPVSSFADVKPPMPTLMVPPSATSMEDMVRSLVVDTFKDTVQKMTINGITPDVSGTSVSFSIPVAPRASEQFQAINPPATLSPPTPPTPPATAPVEPAPVATTAPAPSAPPTAAPEPATTPPPTPPVLLSPVMPSTAGITSTTTGVPPAVSESTTPPPPSTQRPPTAGITAIVESLPGMPAPEQPSASAPITPSSVAPTPSLNFPTPSLPAPNLASLELPPPPSPPPAPKMTAGEYFDAKETQARTVTRTAIESGEQGFSLSAPTTGIAGMEARQARAELYKEAGMDAVSAGQAEAEYKEQVKAYQEFKASGMTGNASDILREDGGVLSDKRGRNEMRGEYEARIEERQNIEKQNGANVSEAIKNGDSSYLSKGFVPVLFTRADGQRKIIVQLDNSMAGVVEGAASGERVTDLPDDSAYYLAEKGGTFAFRLTTFTEGSQARVRVSYGEINGQPPNGMVEPSAGNPEGGFVLGAPNTGYIFAIVTFNPTTREINSRSIGFGADIPDDTQNLVHFVIGKIERVPGIGNNPDTYRILHQAQAGHINFVEGTLCIDGDPHLQWYHVYAREPVKLQMT